MGRRVIVPRSHADLGTMEFDAPIPRLYEGYAAGAGPGGDGAVTPSGLRRRAMEILCVIRIAVSAICRHLRMRTQWARPNRPAGRMPIVAEDGTLHPEPVRRIGGAFADASY